MIDHIKANLLIHAKKLDLTLAGMAREAGYSKQQLNNMFYRQDMNQKRVRDFAEVLQVEPEELTKEVTPKEFGAKVANPIDRVRENLKMIAAEFGLTFSDIIKGTGLTEPVFRKAFRRNEPRMDVIEKICKFIGIDSDELFEEVDYERYGKALVPRIKN